MWIRYLDPDSVVICNPRHVHVGSDVTIEPLAVLMGAPEGELRIGSETLIAPHAYLQGLGRLRVGEHVGVGAGVWMLTAVHAETPPGEPITAAPLRYGEIEVADGCDLGVGSILLPGPRLGTGVQVGAGAVVRGQHPSGAVIAGVPARLLRARGEGDWANGLHITPPPAPTFFDLTEPTCRAQRAIGFRNARFPTARPAPRETPASFPKRARAA
jgi:acetyltransferase-like isoleucine patch superfamily enzyme